MMKKIQTSVNRLRQGALLLLLGAFAIQGAKAQDVPLKNFDDSASYAIGRDIYNNLVGPWKRQNLPINSDIAIQAMIDCANGHDRLTDQNARPLLMRFQKNFEERSKASIQPNIEAGKKFLQENANNKSVKTTATGLQYLCKKKGNGKKPSLHIGEKGATPDNVKVHYTGRLIDGKVFDSSVQRGTPLTFRLDQVIPGWTEGLQLMDEGSTYMLYIPYNLAYGEQQAGEIPPGSTLIFEVELLEINPK